MLNWQKLPPGYNREMYFEGVPQIEIGSAILLRQPQLHDTVDADDHISPWSRVDWWSIQDTYILFLCMLSKIAYHRLDEKQQARTDLAWNLLTITYAEYNITI